VRYLDENTTEEQRKAAIDDIKKYEETSKSVLFARLIETGVLKKVLMPKVRYTAENGVQKAIDWQDLEDKSLYIRRMALYAIDSIVDDGCERTDYYIFTPASEEDIKDIMVLAKLNNVYRPEMTSWNKDKWPEHMFLTADSIEVGKNYILALNEECERWEAYELDHMISQFKRMVDYFSDIAKAQRKALKK
jgi:rhamnogalacturonyl hydrolase YesR